MSDLGASVYLSFDCPACKVRIHSAPSAEIVCPACGASIHRYESPQSLPDPYSDFDRVTRIPSSTVVQGKRWLPYAFLDPILDCEAAYFLMPEDWIFDGGVLWSPDNPSLPARPWLHLTDPTGDTGIEIFPALAFAWNDNPYMQTNAATAVPAGAIEFHPPLEPQRALEDIILPRYRSLPELKVLSLQALPQLPAGYMPPRAIPSGVRFTAAAAQARLTYTRGGNAIEEEMTVVTECMQTEIDAPSGPLSGYYWRIVHAQSLFAPAGLLAEQGLLLQNLLSAVAPAPIWERRVQSVSQRLLSDALTQTQTELDKPARAQVEKAQSEPEPQPDHLLERQCAFRKVWQSGDRYIVTNDENYSPNANSEVWTVV
jgi:predicted RNA-binding Zn-ribbon protein involved in translation (DUF1610 family)